MSLTAGGGTAAAPSPHDASGRAASQGGEPPANSDRSASLVSVVVPAFNAERFIDETLRSVRAQTHQALEIIVVDDGSSDGTRAIVERHAAADARIQLIVQANAGVAAARNAAIAAARGEFVAPVDADDLWAPDKIERQLQAFDAAGPGVGLVYSWFALIDEESRIISTRSRPSKAGDVLERMCEGNLPGNASSAMMPRAVVLEFGGYDVSLHAHKAQGCEDLKLYWAIAERYAFACVPAFLTGYRLGRNNMSTNLLTMQRSFDLAIADFAARRTDLAPAFHEGRIQTARWLAIRAIRAGRWSDARVLLKLNWRIDRARALRFMLRLPIHLSRVSLEGLSWRIRHLLHADHQFLD